MMKRASIPFTAVALALFTLLAVLPVGADNHKKKGAVATTVDGTPLDADVHTLLKAMSDQLAAAKQFTFRAEVLFDEALDSGQIIQHGATIDAAVSRPSGVRANLESDYKSRKLWINGKTATILDVDKQVYAQVKVPARIDDALDHLMKTYDISLALADLAFENPYESLTSGSILEAFYIGKVPVDGRMCHHLAFRQELIDWQVWIEDGLRQVPRKVVIKYVDVEGAPQYMARLTEWNLDARLDDSIFEPKLAADATKVDLLEVDRVVGQN